MRDSALQQRVDALRSRIDGLRAQSRAMGLWATEKEREYVRSAIQRAQRRLAMLLEDEQKPTAKEALMAKSRAGRKRLKGVKRTASGQRSRAADAYQENIEPILTRMRMFGLSEKDARDQKASSFIGRLQLTKVINQAQYDAAIAFFDIHDNYKRAISAPDGMKSSGGAGGGGDTEGHAAWCRTAIAKYDRAIAAVQEEQSLHENRGATMIAALDFVVLRDEQTWHLVGDCRLALNALAHHLGIQRKVWAASMAA